MLIKSEYKKCPGIYIFTNKINGKVYIGETLDVKRRMNRYNKPTNLRPFERALLKYGLDGFHLELEYLTDFKKDDLLDLEESLIKRFKSLVSENGYNVASRGKNTSGHKLSEETKLKMSQCKMGDKNPNYGKPLTDEAKEVLRKAFTGDKNPNYGKTISDEQKEKLSMANKGRKLSPEIRNKMSKSSLGKKLSEGAKLKISKANSGRKRTEEQKASMRKPKSEEGREKIRKAASLRRIPEEVKKQRKAEYMRIYRLAKKEQEQNLNN